ncbi:MAG TPA: IS110 family transposase [Phycisphaerae bacterium]|nr:IS110 family transposase [Phycisphaerae bacterium]
MYFIGCDVSKATLDAAWFNKANGNWVEKQKIPNSRSGWKGLLKYMLTACQCEADDICLVVEATGVYHRPLADLAYGAGVRVIITNPGRAAEHASSHNRLNKNDRIDARGLQQYGRQLENAHDYEPDSPQIQALRALLSRLRQLDKDIQRERNRLEKCAFIAQSKVLAASIKRQTRQLIQERELIQGKIDSLISEHPSLKHIQARLISIKGIGKITSQWLLPLLYREQFESARQLAAFLGLTPIHRTSGTSLKKRGRLSGRGDCYLRSRLYMPAVCAKRHDPAMAACYDTLIRRGKTPKQALTAIIRKLVHVAYGVIKNDEPYRCPVPA